MPYQIKFTTVADADLAAIKDRRIIKSVISKIEGLGENPELGKPLRRELKGFRSLTVLGRWRVIYKIQHNIITVLILVIGMRRQGSPDDVYEMATKRL